MFLLESALTGKLPSGQVLTEQVQQLLANAALDCLCISSDAFVYGDLQTSHAALSQLRDQGPSAASTLLSDKSKVWPRWISTFLSALDCLTHATEQLRQERTAAEEIARIMHLLLDLAQMNLLALQERPIAVAEVANDLPKWIVLYHEFGIVHYNILNEALAHVFRLQLAPPGSVKSADIMTEMAYRLLDSAEQLNRMFLNSERYADILTTAHKTLLLYSTALRLLRWSQKHLEKVNLSLPTDLIKEIGVTEECRVACVETLNFGGATQIAQAINIMGLKRKPGTSLRAALRHSFLEASARIPHYPSKLKNQWFSLLNEIGAEEIYPYSAELMYHLLATTFTAMKKRFHEIFIDKFTVNSALRNSYWSGTLSLYTNASGGHESNDRSREREAQAALDAGKTAYFAGDLNAAIIAVNRAIEFYENIQHRTGQADALQVLVDIAQAYYNQGGQLVNLGRFEEAVAAYEQVVERFGHRSEAPIAEVVAKALVNQGITLGELGRPEVEAWCAPTANGKTIVTTRSRSLKALGKALDLKVLEPDEALALLTGRRLPTGASEYACAVRLCHAMGYHPLALDVLGALLRRWPSDTPYAAWEAKLAEPADDALRLAEALQEELPTGAARYIGTVLRAGLDGLAPDALELLRLAVSLADAPIPANLVLGVFEKMGSTRAEAEARWLAGIEAGQARSLLDTLDTEGELPAPAYSVHALVCRVLAYEDKEPGKERITTLRAAALAVTSDLFDGVGDIRNHARMLPLVAHAERLEGSRETYEETCMAFVVAYLHQVRGSFREAHSAWERARDARIRLLGPEHPDTLGTMHNLAMTLKAQGALTDALQLEERVLEAQTRLLGPEHPDTLGTMQNLVESVHAQGDLARARQLSEQTLQAWAGLLGPEHPATLASLHNLAVVLDAQGDLTGGRQLKERVLEARTRVLGPEHPDTLTTVQNLAGNLKAQGDLAGARQHYERALEAQTRVLGPEHPDALTTLQNLAGNLKAQGDLAGARQHYERALEARTRVLGPEHPDTLLTVQNLAGTLYAQGDLTDARRLEERALEAQTRLLGPEHPDMLMTLQNLAVILYAQGDRAGARQFEERALEVRTRLLGPEHPDTLGTLQSLAGTLYAQGDRAGARQILERALEARTRLFGSEHPSTIETRFKLVLVLHRIDPAAAAPHLMLLKRLRERDPSALSAIEPQGLAWLGVLLAELPALVGGRSQRRKVWAITASIAIVLLAIVSGWLGWWR